WHRDSSVFQDFDPSLRWAAGFFKRVIERPWIANYDTAHALCLVGMYCLYTPGVTPEEMGKRLEFCRKDLEAMDSIGAELVKRMIEHFHQRRPGRDSPLDECLSLARSFV
ncbi:MAG: hypothetical protein AB7V46_20620, partial [Thermomicrobiales bacterium]